MNLWIARCSRTATCSYCQEDILLGEPVIIGKLYRSFEGGERHWLKTFHWHVRKPDSQTCCWVVQGLIKLAETPFVETRGKKLMPLSKEARDRRLYLLRKRARLVADVKFHTLGGTEQVDIDKMTEIGSIMLQLKEEIALVGGVPKSWE